MAIYDFRCAQGHLTERRAGIDVTSLLCRCGDLALRQSVYRFSVGEPEGFKESRADVRSFQEASMEVDHAYTKAEDKGMPVKRPNLWKKAKRNAAI